MLERDPCYLSFKHILETIYLYRQKSAIRSISSATYFLNPLWTNHFMFKHLQEDGHNLKVSGVQLFFFVIIVQLLVISVHDGLVSNLAKIMPDYGIDGNWSSSCIIPVQQHSTTPAAKLKLDMFYGNCHLGYPTSFRPREYSCTPLSQMVKI